MAKFLAHESPLYDEIRGLLLKISESNKNIATCQRVLDIIATSNQMKTPPKPKWESLLSQILLRKNHYLSQVYPMLEQVDEETYVALLAEFQLDPHHPRLASIKT